MRGSTNSVKVKDNMDFISSRVFGRVISKHKLLMSHICGYLLLIIEHRSFLWKSVYEKLYWEFKEEKVCQKIPYFSFCFIYFI